jgi:GT2 family glycosyltransferase
MGSNAPASDGASPARAGAAVAEAEAATPLVSVVVVNYNGAPYLRSLLPSLLSQSYPSIEIVVVDNASTDSSAELLAGMGPPVRLVRSERNLGFAAGNNLGVSVARGRYVALLNSDAVAEPDWLRPLVREVERDPEVAGVGSKITFLKPYLRLILRAPVFRPVDHGLSGDGRALGLCLDETSCVLGCDYPKPLFLRGFGGRELRAGRAARWTEGRAELLLPIEPGNGDRTLVLRAAGAAPNAGRLFTVELGDRTVGSALLSDDFAEHRFVLPEDVVSAQQRYVINNAGSLLDERGVAGDRGIYSLDEGQYDRAEDVPALCGCSMLLRRSVFDGLGGFDPVFFMYFEDVDLSWRLRRRGFRLRYQPASVVRHVHAGTSTEGSALFVFYTARNRLLMLLKNAPWSSVGAAWWQELRHTVVLARRWRRTRRGDPARGTAFDDFLVRVHVFASALLHCPAALARRWRG